MLSQSTLCSIHPYITEQTRHFYFIFRVLAEEAVMWQHQQEEADNYHDGWAGAAWGNEHDPYGGPSWRHPPHAMTPRPRISPFFPAPPVSTRRNLMHDPYHREPFPRMPSSAPPREV